MLSGLAATPLSAASPCDAQAFRQFDFWLGEWEVSVAGKGTVGHNSIVPIVDGCALRETYTTPNGYHGTSYNSYNPATGKWHQTWVDNTGLTLLLAGDYLDGVMVLTGAGVTQDGKPVEHRISWMRLANGDVRQLWESRPAGDAGAWGTLFDGHYSRVKTD